VNSQTPKTVASLVCHAHVEMALACLGSLLGRSGDALCLRIHDDGSLTDADRAQLEGGLPGSVVVSPAEADEVVLARLAAYPECRAFRKRSVLARKLFDVPLLSTGPFVFCDSDVWWFRPFEGLAEFPDASTQVVFMRDNQEAYSLRPWDLLGRHAVRVPSRVNTGLILAKPGVLDLDFLEWLLGLHLPSFERFPLWAEQTCWAALGRRAGCRIWDPGQVRVVRDATSLNPSLVAGHFTSEVRSLLPSPGGSSSAGASPPSVKLRTIPSKPLGGLGLTLSQVRRFFRTRFLHR